MILKSRELKYLPRAMKSQGFQDPYNPDQLIDTDRMRRAMVNNPCPVPMPTRNFPIFTLFAANTNQRSWKLVKRYNQSLQKFTEQKIPKNPYKMA